MPGQLALFLAAYATTVAAAASIILWGVARRLTRSNRLATAVAIAGWLLLVVPPGVASAIGRWREAECGPGDECLAGIVAVLGFGAGWAPFVLLLVALATVAMLRPRARARS